MSEIANAVEKHLGRKLSSVPPTHYELLGIAEDAPPDAIKSALRQASAAWNNSDTKANPESAQLVARLLRQAQSTLLDEASRKKYDAMIPQKVLVPAGAVEYFPSGDPWAAFEPQACLVGMASEGSWETFGSVSQRWESLTRQMPGLLRQSELREVVEPESLIFESTTRAKPQSSDSAGNRIEMLKRARAKRQAVTWGLVLGGAVLFLGYAGIRFAWNRMQIQEQMIADAKDTEGGASDNLPAAKMEEKGENAGPAKSKEPRTRPKKEQDRKGPPSTPSGLPSLATDPAEGAGMQNKTQAGVGDPFMANPAKMPEGMENGQPMIAVPPSKPDPAAPKPADAPATMEVKSPETKPDVSKPAETLPAETKPSETMPAMNAGPGMNANDKKAWAEAMKKGKEAIEKADFELFQKQMELALPLSASEEMQAKRARLDQLGQLYEIFIKSVREAKSKTRATEAITVGKNKVNIVEVKEKVLIVRIQGKNETYAWDSLPPGIALAMADLTLSEREPTDLAARAVYFSLSPSRNELVAKKVKDWFDKSVGKGEIRADLPQALTDTYE
jgi:hypothetical protein